MHIIKNKDDLTDMPLTFSAVKGILTARLTELLTMYEVDTISSFGAFILLESAKEIKRYNAMELTEPITADSIEWVESIKTDNTLFYNICVVKDDVFAVNIFIPQTLIDEHINRLIGGFIDENI